VDDQLAKGLVVELKPTLKRAISPMPASKPIRLTGPNSVFDLGNVFAKS
jgi:Rrf2 family iron-sulfur cluster assembly transcriptional regulator